MKCFFHRSDLDGVCSAAIVKYKHPECECIGVDYGDDFERVLSTIEMEEVIFVVDFSFDMEIMTSLSTEYNLHWIDHHKTAIKKCEGLDIKGLRKIGKAGCELTWEYLFPEKEMSKIIKLLGRYDIWDDSNKEYWNNEILPFQYGMRLKNYNVNNIVWGLIFNTDTWRMSEIIDQGKVCLQYQKQLNEKACQNSFEIEFKGYKAICVNSQGFNSQVFDSVYDESKHDMMLCFAYTGKNWKVSLYSTKEDIDVSEIAKEMGGGGHKGAAGFIVDDINNEILIKQ